MQCDLYDSVEALLAKLQSGNSGYDIVVPSDYAVQILQRRALAEPPRQSANSKPGTKPRPAVPRPRCSTPGIAIPFPTRGAQRGLDTARTGLGSLQTVGKCYGKSDIEARIVMLDDMRENFGAALKLSGFSINSRNPAQLETAKALLDKQKPLLQAYNSSNFQELLVSGDAWLVQGWNGQIVKAARENPNIGYLLPTTRNNAVHRFFLHSRRRVSQSAGAPVHQLHARARNSRRSR